MFNVIIWTRDLLQKVVSEKGKPLLIFKEFKFPWIGETKNGMKWKCTVKSCPSNVFSDESETMILTWNLNHNHESSVKLTG